MIRLASLLVALLLVPFGPRTTGTLHLEPERVDGGHVLAGASTEACFAIVNDSAESVAIEAVQGTCACHLTLELPDGTAITPPNGEPGGARPPLAPGQRARVVFGFDGDHTAPLAGHIEKPMKVRFVGVKEPLVATLVLEVERTYAFDPPELAFGSLEKGTTAERVVRFTTGALGPAKIETIELPPQSPVTIEVRDVSPASAPLTGYELTARATTAALPFGDKLGRLHLRLDRGPLRSIPLDFALKVVPPILVELDRRDVTTSPLSFGVFRIPEKATRKLTVHARAAAAGTASSNLHPVTAARVECKTAGVADCFTAKVTPLTDGGDEITLELLHTPPVKSFSGTLVLTLAAIAPATATTEWTLSFSGLVVVVPAKPAGQ